jgi:hypothetical protein
VLATSTAAALWAVRPVAAVPQAKGPAFVEAAAATGLVFTHVNGAAGKFYLHEQMGAGVALFDYDNDGDLDVYLVQGAAPATAAAARGQSPAGAPTSRLFRNDLPPANGGRRTPRFTDVTAKAGVGLVSQGMGAAVGDYDGDGWLDLFVTTFGRDVLYRNNGNGTFTDRTAEAGVSDPLWSAGASFFDYDRDHDLDLFVANYVSFTEADKRQCFDQARAPHYCPPHVYRPSPDRLYRNDGKGRFTDVTDRAGISRADGSGLGVVAGDFNGDGWLDFYVANDGNANQLWINQQDGTFRDDALLSGSALNAAGNPEASMGLGSGDFDADGDEDLFVTNDLGETFVLYLNDGHGLFADARVRTGLAAPTGRSTGFGTDWIDFDNDGWLDLFMANGAVQMLPRQRGQPRPYRMPNQLFRNTGGGRFVEVPPAVAGPDFQQTEIGRGAAFGDLDNDGDIDIVVTTNGGPAKLLLNQGTPGHAWLQVRLEQPSANRYALGALVRVERAGGPTLWRRVKTDGSYLSASDSRVHVGLGAGGAITGLEVRWPDGARERFAAPKPNQLATLTRGTGQPAAR